MVASLRVEFFSENCRNGAAKSNETRFMEFHHMMHVLTIIQHQGCGAMPTPLLDWHIQYPSLRHIMYRVHIRGWDSTVQQNNSRSSFLGGFILTAFFISFLVQFIW